MILKSIEFHSKNVVINAARQHVHHTKIKEKLQRKSPMPFFIPLEICTNVKQHFKNKKQHNFFYGFHKPEETITNLNLSGSLVKLIVPFPS